MSGNPKIALALATKAQLAQGRLEQIRRQVVKQIQQAEPLQTYQDLVHDLASEEVRNQTFHTLSGVAEKRGSESLKRLMIQVMLEGPDDTWSGRYNDLRRVRYEARLSAYREANQLLLAEED